MFCLYRYATESESVVCQGLQGKSMEEVDFQSRAFHLPFFPPPPPLILFPILSWYISMAGSVLVIWEAPPQKRHLLE